MRNCTRLIFRNLRTTKLLVQAHQTLLIEKLSLTKNLHRRAPIPEIDEGDPFPIADVCESKAHEGTPVFTLSTSPRRVGLQIDPSLLLLRCFDQKAPSSLLRNYDAKLGGDTS